VTNLLRQGWTEDSVKVGDRLTAKGSLGRDGAKKLNISTLVKADGTRVPQAAGTGRAGAGPAGPNTAAAGGRAGGGARGAGAGGGGRGAVNATAGKDYGYKSGTIKHPVDITGGWRNDYRWRVTVDDLEPKPTPFTDEGRRIFEATEAWHDPSMRCVAPGLPRIFGAPYNADIIDAGDHYLMLYLEHNTPRRIYMDGRTPPANTPRTPMGYSVGRWEDGALVVETTHLSAAWLDGSGLPMKGEGTRIVERYVPSADGLTMERTMTIHDPYYTAPLVRQRFSARDDAIDLTEQASCDPDSYYRDLSSGGRLEEHFAR
jgi:hypothetical protein